jgi:hypothetical protein
VTGVSGILQPVFSESPGSRGLSDPAGMLDRRTHLRLADRIRRLIRDHEVGIEHSGALIYLSMTKRLLVRIAALLIFRRLLGDS